MHSENVKNIKEQINKFAISESRIFINGPTGSGKELIARKIHIWNLKDKKDLL